MSGTITGVGCNIGIIDDPIKNDKEAFNDRVLAEHWSFYVDTFLSRLEKGSIQIINMTRWATQDLCGKILESEGDRWHILKMAAYNEDTEEMLCPSLLSYEDYLDKKAKTSPAIFGANYLQEPVDEIGRMYKEFKTYDELPEIGERHNYTDTADTGADYLCSINYQISDGKIYILDILYTKKSMEYTEPAVAKMLAKDQIQRAKIESNNGGRGFARNVKRLLGEIEGGKFVTVKTFTQTKNKKSRIWSNSYWIEENVYYPKNWGQMWGEFYASMKNYKREGTNDHDDAQDCLTGCAEQVNKPKRIFK
jgi:predicted phage terminase large subunit-like protein